MENNIEKLISEGKALVGYDQNDVKDEILNLQNSYTEKKNRLLQEIELVKAENKVLKEKLDSLVETPTNSHGMEEISSTLMNVFLDETREIYQLKTELERQEKPYYETLKLRRKQKELAKRGVQEASDFLKSLQEDFSYLQKETDQ